MWRPSKVERALFAWRMWRRSVVGQWRESNVELEDQPLESLRQGVDHELAKLGFPRSAFLEVYWICCVMSDYRLDAPATYDRIVMPAWVPARYRPFIGYTIEVKRGFRPTPPILENEADVLRLAIEYQGERDADPTLWMPKEHENRMFLPPHHELWGILRKHRGRTRTRRVRGRPSTRSDRLAVTSAMMKDGDGESYVDIAKELDLLITRPYESFQSDTARHLVARGRRVLAAVFPEEYDSDPAQEEQ